MEPTTIRLAWDEVETLRAYFRETPLEGRCPGCGRFRAADCSVEMLFAGDTVPVRWTAVLGLGANGHERRRVEIARVVEERLLQVAAPLLSLLGQEIDARWLTELHDRHAELQAPVFAATLTLVQDGPTARAVAFAQVQVWRRIAVQAAFLGPDLTTLLEMYTCRATVTGEAIRILSEQVSSDAMRHEEDPAKTAPELVGYFAELALLAQLCSRLSIVNPLRYEWTRLLFASRLGRFPEEISEMTQRVEPPPEALSSTLDRGAISDSMVGPSARRSLAARPDVYIDVASDLGFRSTALDAIGTLVEYDRSADDPRMDKALRQAEQFFAEGSVAMLEVWAKTVVRAVIAADDEAAFLTFAAGLTQVCASDPDVRAQIAGSIGDACTAESVPGWFGASALADRSFDGQLSPSSLAAVLTQRASVAKQAGDHEVALEFAQRVTELELTPHESRVAHRNLADSLRIAGRLSEAYTIVRALMADDDPNTRIDDLCSWVMVLVDMRRWTEIVDVTQHVEEIYRGAVVDPALRLARVEAFTLLGAHERALVELHKLELHSTPWLLGASFIVAHGSGHETAVDADELIAEIDKRVLALEAGGSAYQAGQLRVGRRAVLQSLGRPHGPETGSVSALMTSAKPFHLCEVAIDLFCDDKVDEAWAAVVELPSAIERSFGSAHDETFTPDRELLDRMLEYLIVTAAVRGRATRTAMRWLRDLRRDALGASRRGESLHIVPSDRALLPLARDGKLAVLEFLRLGDVRLPELTVVDASEVTGLGEEELPLLDFDALKHVSELVRGRLDVWPGREPPWACSAWTAIEDWLRRVASLVDGLQQLVIFEDSDYPDIPWHAADVPFNVSYGASWRTLLHADHALRSRESLATVFVPLADESAVLIAAANDVRSELAKTAHDSRMHFEELSGVRIDGRILAGTLERTDVVALICHGVRDSHGAAALCVAADGTLPSVTSDGTLARHLVSAVDFEACAQTPSLVASAACSSGRVGLTSTGDRPSLHRSLAWRGTNTLIAPRWDVPASIALPLIARTIDLHVRAGLPIARALRSASDQAVAAGAGWQGRAFAIEGSSI